MVIMGLLLSGCAKAPAEAEAAKSPVAEAKTDEPAGDSKTGEASVVYPVVTQVRLVEVPGSLRMRIQAR